MAWMDVMNMTADVDYVLLCFPHLPDSCRGVQRHLVLKVVIYILMLASVLMTIFGNLLVIITISHFKQLHSPTNFIILSLAVADCLLGCLVMPFSMVRWLEGCWYLGDMFCQIHSSVDMTLSIASILHLCLVSVDRYLAICEPLSYRMKMTNDYVAVCIAIIWLFSFAFSFGVIMSKVNMADVEDLLGLNSCIGNCALIYNKPWSIILTFVAFFIPGAIMSSLYLKIFYVARKQAKVMSERTAVRRTSCETQIHSSEQRERKAAKTLGIVMGIFQLCWLPFFIATLYDPFHNFSTPLDVFNALVWFGYLNSTFNPLVYGFFYPRFQRAFKIIISRYVLHLSHEGHLVL